MLNLATESSDNPDLRDRGYVYWRLLSTDPTAARKVVLAERPVISAETFSLPPDYLSVLLENLSSLSSVYHRPPNEFVRGSRSVTFMPYQEAADGDDDDSDSDDSDGDSSSDDDEDGDDGDGSNDGGGDDGDSDNDSDEGSDDSDSSSGGKRKKRKKKKGKNAKTTKSPGAQQQAPPQQEQPADDLLGDILGMGISSTPQQAPPQQTQTAMGGGGGGGGFDDIFGAFDNAPSSSSPPKGPPLSMAFDGAKGQGLEMALGFQRENGCPLMVVQAANRSNNAISRIDIKFNKNYLGIQPKATVPLNGQINPGQTQTVRLQLQLTQPPTPKKPLDLTVQMAARSIRANTAKPPVTMFAVQIPAEIFFDSNDPQTLSDRNAFLAEWRSIPNTEDQSQTIKQCKNTDVGAVKAIFMRNSCQFIADRQIPNRGVSLYFASTLKSVAVLLEVSLANNGACRVVVKSKDKYLSFVACNTAVKLVNL